MAHKFFLRDPGGRDNPIGDATTGGAATTIGRDAACQIILSGDVRVSRRHALLWAQGDSLYVRDENSSNGTFVNGRQLTPNEAAPLRLGDKLGVGDTLFLVIEAEAPPATVMAPGRASPVAKGSAPAAPVAAPPRRRPSFLVACAAVGAILALVVCAAGGVLLASRGPSVLAGLTGPATPGAPSPGAATPGAGTPEATTAGTTAQATVLGTSELPPLLSPQQYAASNQDLARAVAQLNLAELDFVRAASGGAAFRSLAFLARPALHPLDAGGVEAKLLNVAANAFNTATIADRLSQTAASQGGGSEAAGRTASHYRGISRLAAALVIEAQNARQGLAAGTVSPKTAASTIAEYGSRLWNPSAIDPAAAGNPFTPLLPASAQIPPAQNLSPQTVNQLATQLGGNLTTWVAASGETITKTLTVPPPTGPVTVKNDAASLAKMSTVEGQSDADAANALSRAIIEAGGGVDTEGKQQSGGGVVATFWSAASVSSPKDQSTGSPTILPTYPNGSGSAVTTGAKPDDTLSTLVDIGTGGEVKLGQQTPIQDTKAAVSLTLSNLTITAVNKRPKGETFEADVDYGFDVQWTTNLIAPQFELACNSGNHFAITSASGTQHVSAKGLLILYPGAEDAFCYASRNGNTLGSVSIHFLVGDAAEATQRAIQVETDSVALDLTLTADAVGTQNAASTNAAATQSVLGTQNALETEVSAQQTEEFAATITAIARLTQLALPVVSETPSATPTFVPVFVEELFHSGDMFATSTKNVMQTGHLFRFCFSGEVNLVNPDRSVPASEIDHVNGIAVPRSGCLVIEGDGKAAVITCGTGEAASDPGGYTIRVFDLGPT
jgi:hypothetical protein